LVVVVILAPGLFLGGLFVAGSTRTIYEREKSPDGWREARVQFDDGGAISRFSRLVFVKPSWNFSDEPLLSCRAFYGDGEAKVRLVWKDSHTLLVIHHFAPDRVKDVSRACGPIRIIARAERPFDSDK
jgi:hypothetical protein